MSGRGARPRRRGGGHARRTRQPLRGRVRRWLPTPGRLLALLAFAALVTGGVLLVNGPWLRVGQLAFAGTTFTPDSEVEALLMPYRGTPILALDRSALSRQLESLPAVARARVEPVLPDRLQVTITEKRPAVVWQTATAQLVGAADGSVIGALPGALPLPAELARLPRVDDRRSGPQMAVGEAIPSEELDLAKRLVTLDPELLGSAAHRFRVRIDTTYGFVLIPEGARWEAAIGYPTPEPGAGPTDVAGQLDDQVAAIRTLFGTRRERTIGWVDARNPGKVYWAP
jgi:cell division septal protein FtsQ